MKDLIEALQIFLAHDDVSFPFHCEHDTLYVCGYDRSQFTDAEMARLKELGFNYSDSDEHWYSFRYGSC